MVRPNQKRASLGLISAVSNQGELALEGVGGPLKAPALICFLERLIREVLREVFLILDNLPAHRSRAVRAWLAERRKQIEVFHLPACCPELNPDEGHAADSRPGQRLMARLSTMWRLMPLAPQQTLVVDPALPDWLPEIVARHVQVGEEHADLRFWRDDAGCTQVEVLEAGNQGRAPQ